MTGRFAIYAVPGTGPASADGPDGPVGPALRERAEQWLGRSVAGQPVAPAAPPGWTRESVDAITASARRYGFHATLKAPFRLAPGRTPEELGTAVARFAACQPSAPVPRLSLARLGSFYALVPGAGAAGLHALADAVVTSFDRFRAPATAAETARRHPASLSPRQRELLAAWGYPYVLDEFRFHLTLTDRIRPGRQPAVERALSSWFADFIGRAVPVDALALCTEAEPGAPFRLHAVYPLTPLPAVRTDGRTAESEGSR